MKWHHKPRFTWQVPREDNPEGEYLRVQASGIAVRVVEKNGTWQAKRPTTHSTGSKIEKSDGDILNDVFAMNASI